MMVKNITVSSIAPGKDLLNSGHLKFHGGVRVQAIAGKDRYQRAPGRPWVIESIVGGRGWIRHQGQVHSLSTGDTYVFNPEGTYEYGPDDDDPWEKVFIEMSGPLMDALGFAYGLDHALVYKNRHAQVPIETMIRLLQAPTNTANRQLPLALHQLLIRLSAMDESAKPSMLDYVEHHIEEAFDLDAMATEFNYSKNQLLRNFKKLHGTTPYDHLLTRRVDYAGWILTNTSMPLKELATRLHFSDTKHLSSTLKKRTGKNPTQWRDEKYRRGRY